MCASHPIPQKAVAALPATPPPDLHPIETAVPEDAAKVRADMCEAAIRRHDNGELRHVFSGVTEQGPWVSAQTDFFDKCEDAFDKALEKCIQAEAVCRPSRMAEIRVLNIPNYGWIGIFSRNLEMEA